LLTGFVEMRAPLLNPFVGAGPVRLQFVRDATEFDILVPAQRKVAFLCSNCGAAVITDQVWTA
jgi:hypothetical protein